MIYATGFLDTITVHDDGRVSMQRADLKTGTFLHIQFTEKELAALKDALKPPA